MATTGDKVVLEKQQQHQVEPQPEETAPPSYEEAMKQTVVYEDAFCRVHQDRIVIKNYFFPVFKPKTIMFADIQSAKRFPNESILSTKMWGMGLSDIWWAMDFSNIGRPDAVVIDCGDWPRKGFSAESPDRVVGLLQYGMHSVASPFKH